MQSAPDFLADALHSARSRLSRLGFAGGRQHKRVVVSEGDTLWELAQRHGLDDWAHIAAFNKLKDDVIRVGDVLTIPPPPPSPPPKQQQQHERQLNTFASWSSIAAPLLPVLSPPSPLFVSNPQSHGGTRKGQSDGNAKRVALDTAPAEFPALTVNESARRSSSSSSDSWSRSSGSQSEGHKSSTEVMGADSKGRKEKQMAKPSDNAARVSASPSVVSRDPLEQQHAAAAAAGTSRAAAELGSRQDLSNAATRQASKRIDTATSAAAALASTSVSTDSSTAAATAASPASREVAADPANAAAAAAAPVASVSLAVTAPALLTATGAAAPQQQLLQPPATTVKGRAGSATVWGKQLKTVVVREGDTAWDIALRFGVELEELVEANRPKPSQNASPLFALFPSHQKQQQQQQAGSVKGSQADGGALPERERSGVRDLMVLYPGDVLRLPPHAVELPGGLVGIRGVTAVTKRKPKGRQKGVVEAGVAESNRGADAGAKGRMDKDEEEVSFSLNLKGTYPNASTFFHVFPPPRGVDKYRERYRALLDAMRYVETSFIMPAPTGDGGLSIGPLQISDDYHTDAWWLLDYTDRDVRYADCEEVDHSERTVVNYWLRYCPWALEFGDNETLARMHNGGPLFYRHLATTTYWRKVRSAMRHAGWFRGVPEMEPRLSANTLMPNGVIQLFQTHFAFPSDISKVESETVLQ